MQGYERSRLQCALETSESDPSSDGHPPLDEHKEEWPQTLPAILPWQHARNTTVL